MSARPATQGRLGRALMIAAIVAVAATVATALVVMDPPARQRAERLDERRVADLQVLEERISAHHAVHEALPAAMSGVDDGPGQAIVDPVSGEPYGYEVTGPSSFRLCARFDTESDGPAERHLDSWRHAAGLQCFDRDAARDPPHAATVLSPSAAGQPSPPKAAKRGAGEGDEAGQ